MSETDVFGYSNISPMRNLNFTNEIGDCQERRLGLKVNKQLLMAVSGNVVIWAIGNALISRSLEWLNLNKW